MNEQEALSRMIAAGTKRKGKLGGYGGVIQIHVTRQCDKACFNCTQGSNFKGPYYHISLDNFEKACLSLREYFGVVGMFGGNPALHPQFAELCSILRNIIPKERCGLWCNSPIIVENAQEMKRTFNPSVSNLNVHLDNKAFEMFKKGWPECMPCGRTQDSRHSPVFVAMKDVLRKLCPRCEGYSVGKILHCPDCDNRGYVYDEEEAWELISNCDINQHWSAMMGQFRGELRAWFCEIAGAQSILHQDNPDYPDTGIDPTYIWNHPGLGPHKQWWQLPMECFTHQVRQHCHNCGVPLRGYGELAQADMLPYSSHNLDHIPREQVSVCYESVAIPKRKGRPVEMVTQLVQLGMGKLQTTTKYLQNSEK